MSQLTNLIAKRVRTKCLRALRSVGVHPRTIAALSGGNKLLPSQAADLALMRSDNSAASEPFRATPIWVALAREFDAWFAFEGIADVECQQMNGFFSSPFPGDPKLLRYASWMLFEHLKKRDAYGVLGSVDATIDSLDSDLAFDFDGKICTWDYLISVDSFYTIVEANPKILTDRLTVAELGAGWGRIGHILKRVNPLLTYVVFDLPEVLLVSSVHLPRRLPTETVLSYRDSRSLTRIGRADVHDKGLVFLGAHDLEKCEDGLFDCFINIASFQEMTKTQVGRYFDIVDRVLCGTFYTQQLWTSKTHAYGVGEIAGFEDYPFKHAWEKQFVRNTTWSDLYFETVFQNTERPAAATC